MSTKYVHCSYRDVSVILYYLSRLIFCFSLKVKKARDVIYTATNYLVALPQMINYCHI